MGHTCGEPSEPELTATHGLLNGVLHDRYVKLVCPEDLSKGRLYAKNEPVLEACYNNIYSLRLQNPSKPGE